MSRKICPVSFNLEDPFEKSLLESTENKGPFSKYVKRLILLDQKETKIEVIQQPKINRTAESFI